MSVTIPWIKGVTEANSCKIKNLDTVHAKPCNTICSRLVVVTDKNDKLHKSGTIYHIQCHDCHHAYVHEMGRKLKLKLEEHGRESLSVGELLQNSRRLLLGDFTILDHKVQWFQRRVMETIYTVAAKPSFNKDRR